MKMPTKLQQNFEFVKDSYLAAISRICPGYDINVTMTDVAKQQKQDPVINQFTDDFPPSYEMKVNLTSEIYRKKVEFSFSDGYLEDDNAYYNDFDFSINFLENDHKGSNWFSLKDYLTHNNIKQDYDHFFIPKDFSDTSSKLERFIEVVLLVLQRSDIKHILTSKDWLEVPHDKSMYF